MMADGGREAEPRVMVERRGPVAWLWMNRPRRHNAFDGRMIEELDVALAALDQDPGVRVVVLAGRGRHFSAGADLDWMRRLGEAGMDENREDARGLGRLFLRLHRLRKPSIARVQGAAMAGGLGLAAACSLCVASASAVFAASEVRLGLAPCVICPYVLRAIGPRHAQRYFLTGERIPAGRALEIGLVHEVADDERLDERVAELVEALLAGAPSAQAACMDLMGRLAGRSPSEETLELTSARIAELRASPEGREGLGAFLEKRAPAWMVSANGGAGGQTF